ncbi:hypothetical protein M6D81_21210 [Paenibacillus sp. J5C_2022]|nr:hypothetical protein [Paenibacillus sp. J5C2022]
MARSLVVIIPPLPVNSREDRGQNGTKPEPRMTPIKDGDPQVPH